MHLSRRELLATNGRSATVALVFEVEDTLRWLEQIPTDGHPSVGELNQLRSTIEDRGARIDEAVESLRGLMDGALTAELMLVEAREGRS